MQNNNSNKDTDSISYTDTYNNAFPKKSNLHKLMTDTVLIVGGHVISGIDEKRLSSKQNVKKRFFRNINRGIV